MTNTGSRGIPILDGVATSVAAARAAVSSATRSAPQFDERSSDEKPTRFHIGKLRT